MSCNQNIENLSVGIFFVGIGAAITKDITDDDNFLGRNYRWYMGALALPLLVYGSSVVTKSLEKILKK